MAITNIVLSNPAGISQFTDTAMGGGSVDGVKAAPATLYKAIIDNSLNGGAASYVKLWNIASGSVTIGTTVPDEVIYVPAGAILTHFFYTSATPGKSFSVAISAACVTAGGTAGITSPSNAVKVTLEYA